MPVIFSARPCEFFAAVSVCRSVCSATSGRSRDANSGTCISLRSPQLSAGFSVWLILAFDILTQQNRWRLGCMLCPQGDDWMLLPAAAAAAAMARQLILLFCGHWITRLTLFWRNFRLCPGWTDSTLLKADSVGVQQRSAVYLQRDSSECRWMVLWVCAWKKKACAYICMCKLLAHEGV